MFIFVTGEHGDKKLHEITSHGKRIAFLRTGKLCAMCMPTGSELMRKYVVKNSFSRCVCVVYVTKQTTSCAPALGCAHASPCWGGSRVEKEPWCWTVVNRWRQRQQKRMSTCLWQLSDEILNSIPILLRFVALCVCAAILCVWHRNRATVIATLTKHFRWPHQQRAIITMTRPSSSSTLQQCILSRSYLGIELY